MSRSEHASLSRRQTPGLVGVGLRHPHYRDSLSGTSSIDFLEIHAENFFAEGGVIPAVLEDVSQQYPISLHSTSLGLGSATGVNQNYLTRLERLVNRINPLLVSDHASFAWGEFNGHAVHAGDLLPIEFTRRSIDVLVTNIDRVQQTLGRRILLENLSAYTAYPNDIIPETEFLTTIADKSQCGLLIDLNNCLVNAHNFADDPPLAAAQRWFDDIPPSLIGEIHLAGYTPQAKPNFVIDDHSQPVSEQCWELYHYALERTGPVTTLIEWDNNLPEWHILLEQAETARKIMHQATGNSPITSATISEQQKAEQSEVTHAI
ncbi:Uncharacterised protein [BD1-7 clade bacterium]|uniref:Uncharacterized protein n=1 Tax=BD1-7 clade bacterium TaxID=2029982 RepID=A0A5S9Q646_9GAMM|nr:Uncharacterised protein [BD1-7 clade bacterium]